MIVLILSLTFLNTGLMTNAKGGDLPPIGPKNISGPNFVANWRRPSQNGDFIGNGSVVPDTNQYVFEVIFEINLPSGYAFDTDVKLGENDWEDPTVQIQDDFDGDGEDELKANKTYSSSFIEPGIKEVKFKAKVANFATDATITKRTFKIEDSDRVSYSEEVSREKTKEFEPDSHDADEPQEPAQPQNLTKRYSGYEYIYIQWDEVETATNYTIFRENENGNFIPKKEDHTKTTFYDDGLEYLKYYNYKVKAVNYEGSSARSDNLEVQADRELNPPSGLDVLGTTPNEVDLTWDKPSEVEGGEIWIYRKLDNKSDFGQDDRIKKIGWENNYYEDTGVSPGNTYDYAIRQYYENDENTSSDLSDFSSTVSATISDGPSPPFEFNC